MMEQKFEKMGNELITKLGFENKKVILFWEAYENKSWNVCSRIYEKCTK